MSKVRVAILRGGPSEEYDVSLKSGAAVLSSIDTNRYQPLDVVITKNGEWLLDGKVYLPEHILHCVDVVFNAMHGSYGEDGTVQRLLDRYNVPYTGSKALSSSICINKLNTKDFLRNHEIKMAPHMHLVKDDVSDISRISERIADMFGPQYIIKPVSSGSSVGTMMVKNPALLAQAIEDAFKMYDEILVEARIPGREATVGVLERFRDEPSYALPPVEIIPPPQNEFFDLDAKYSGFTQEICPSTFSKDVKSQLMEISKNIHSIMQLSQYSRSDFIVAKDGIYFLEVNTLPGLTTESLFPKALDAVGVTYKDFVTHLLYDAAKKLVRA